MPQQTFFDTSFSSPAVTHQKAPGQVLRECVGGAHHFADEMGLGPGYAVSGRGWKLAKRAGLRGWVLRMAGRVTGKIGGPWKAATWGYEWKRIEVPPAAKFKFYGGHRERTSR